MIDLSDQQPFASGSNRHCFRHPDDPTLCLKVVRPENIEARYRRQHRLKRLLGKARLDDNQQELRAHRQRALIGLPEQTAWAHLPRFFGQTDTTLGTANVSEFLAAPDGHPAETLEHYLQRCGLDPAIQAAIDRFCAWLRSTGILTRNLLPHNLVIAERNGQPELFLVDGLGAPTIPDALARLPAWRRRYVDRRIRRLHKRVAWELGDRKVRWEEFQRLG